MTRFLADLGGSDGFRTALAISGLGVALVALIGLTIRSLRPVPLGGLPFIGAGAWVLSQQFRMPAAVVVGMAALVVAAMIGRGLWDRMIASIPGAYLIATMGDWSQEVPLIALTVAVAAVAALVADFDFGERDHTERHIVSGYRTVGTVMLAMTVCGLVITVPDTERALVLLGAAAPVALLGPPLRLASLGPTGAAAVGLVAWTAGLAWPARPGATIGTLAAFGLFLVEPLGRRLAARSGRRSSISLLTTGGLAGAVTVTAIHGTLVIGGSRFAGLLQGVVAPLVVALVILALATLVAAAPAPLATDQPKPPPA